MTTPPTVILAHDAFLQPTHYAAFTADLHVRGLTEVRIPQLPSTITSPPPPDDAFAQDVAVLHRTIQSCLRSGRDVVVLAHGYGGLPLGEALEGVTTTARPENVRVLGLVWVAAVVGEEGEDARSARKEGLEGVKVEVGVLCPFRNSHFSTRGLAFGWRWRCCVRVHRSVVKSGICTFSLAFRIHLSGDLSPPSSQHLRPHSDATAPL